MTRFVLPLAAVVSLLTTAVQGTSSRPVDLDAEERAIIARGDEMLSLENAREMSKAVTFYADSVVLQGPGSPEVQGLAQIRMAYARPIPPNVPQRIGRVLTKTVSVAASGDLAWEHGTAETTIRMPTGDVVEYGKHLIVWKKVNGQWYITAMSWSNDKPEERRGR